MRGALLPAASARSRARPESVDRQAVRMDQGGVSNLAEELKELLARNVEGNLELLGRLSSMARETAQSMNSPSNAPQQPGALVGRLVKLNLSYLSLITKHGLAFADEMATITARALGVTKPEQPRTSSASTPAAPPRAEVQLAARVGQTATATFLVENSRPEPLDVSFEASPMVSSHGEAIKRATVRFKPSRLRIKPGAQSTVQVSVKVSPEFKVDEVYLLRARLVGFEQKEILIALRVLPAIPGTSQVKAEPGPTKGKGRRAAKAARRKTK